jgi:hypothetical protein
VDGGGDWRPSFIPPGIHTFAVRYEGNSIQPPNMSNPVTVNVVKADSTTQMGGGFPVAAYKPKTVRVYVEGGVVRVPPRFPYTKERDC